ncbi:MAG: hypothetical protein V4805_14360 [Pseudomonadota bacterium]
MPYSKISSTHAPKTRKLAFKFVAAALIAGSWLAGASNAHAGVEQECAAKEKTAPDFDSCILASQQRSERELRELNKAVTNKLRQNADRDKFRSYATDESRLVRERKAKCELAEKKAAKAKTDPQQARLSCEADLNFSHIESLKRSYPQ